MAKISLKSQILLADLRDRLKGGQNETGEWNYTGVRVLGVSVTPAAGTLQVARPTLSSLLIGI